MMRCIYTKVGATTLKKRQSDLRQILFNKSSNLEQIELWNLKLKRDYSNTNEFQEKKTKMIVEKIKKFYRYVLAKATLFPLTLSSFKAAFTQKASRSFFRNIFLLFFFYALIWHSYFILGNKENFVQVFIVFNFIFSFYFCFWAKTELSRFQAVYVLVLNFLSLILLFEKLSVSFVFLSLSFLFLAYFFLVLVVEFFLVEYFGFFSPLNLAFFGIQVAYLWVNPEILFHLVFQLVLIYLLRFVFQGHRISGSTHFFSLLFLLVVQLFLLVVQFFIGDLREIQFFIGNLDLRETSFHLQSLFLIGGSLVIYLLFLSKTGWELVITFIIYNIINLIIGVIIVDNKYKLVQSQLLILFFICFILITLYFESLKREKSLANIFHGVKDSIFGRFFILILSLLSSIGIGDHSQYDWMAPWLNIFVTVIVVVPLFYFIIEKDDEVFQTLGRKETIFLSTLVIFLSAVFFFLLYLSA